ncbi:MAG: hypothetical protein ACRD0K_16465 [Egibacteraceae bacterium]
MTTLIETDNLQGIRAVRQVNRRYRDHSTWELAERLEQQVDQGEPLDEAIVFELVNRALRAEGAGRA